MPGDDLAEIITRHTAGIAKPGDLIAIAEHGFALLFDGECTIRLVDGVDHRWFSAADTNRDGQISRAEYDAAQSKRQADRQQKQAAGKRDAR